MTLTRVYNERRMKMTKYKTTIAISILVFAMAASLIALPANAQPPVEQRKTYCFVDAVPNPVGTGDECLIRFGIFQQTPNVVYGYSGITVTMVKPDNTSTTLGPFGTDSTGAGYTMYTFATAGTYKLTAHFPQQVWWFGDFFNLEGGNMIFNGTIMLASDSWTLDVVVGDVSVATYPGHPLPSEYWTRPIDPQLREWNTIAGNWVERPDNSLAPFNDDAPETAHVLWREPLTTGGLIGGLLGPGQVPASADTGDAYEGRFPGSVIMNGILYYVETDTRAERVPAIISINLKTGERSLFLNNTNFAFGQILYFNSWNYDGVYTYLWQTVTVPFNPVTNASAYTQWNAYDPFTAKWQFSFRFMPSGFRTRGPSGEILIYQIDTVNNWLALWNSTAAGHAHLGAMGPDYGSWGNSVHGGTWDANVSRAYSWNVSIPAGLQYGTSFFAAVFKYYPDRLVSVWWNYKQVRVWALKTEGLTSTSNSTTTLFDKTWTAPAEWDLGKNTIQYASATNQVAKGVLTLWDKELRKHYGFSVETGNFMWETDSEVYQDLYGWGNAEHTWYFAYGKYFSVGVGGIVYAYDDQTGKAAWTYVLNDPYSESVTAENWWGWIDLIADGKVYVGHLEHSAEMPMPRGAPYVCLNASNGAVIWRADGMFRQTRWGGCGVIGDSIIATMDTYDQQVWAIGKGPTETTLSAPDNGVPLGSSVMIRGTVKDVSPGTESPETALRFPSGVSAVADENQSAWMLYVYKQFTVADPHAEKWIGVTVNLYVVDANMNARPIGTATTSAENGAFAFAWTPDIAGTYYLYADFTGSKAYYGSHAETAFVVDAAPEATATPTPQPAHLADQYLLPATGGIIAAIAVVGIVLALLLRRK